MLLDRGLGQAQPAGDFLVGLEGGQPQTLFLTRAELQYHRPLRECDLVRTFRGGRPDRVFQIKGLRAASGFRPWIYTGRSATRLRP